MHVRLLRCVAVVSVVLALAARAHAADSEATVKALRFEGVAAVSEEELRDAILTAAPGWKFWRPDPPFDEETLREDLERIVSFYRERGYYGALAEYELAWDDERSAVRVAILVREGEPVRLAELSIEIPELSWLDAEARARLRDDLPLVEGEIFGAAVYRAARAELLRRFANLGHPGVSLSGGAEVDPDRLSAAVRWRVQPGPKVQFGAVRVEGLEDVDEKLVRGELTFEQGQDFSLDALEASREQIYDLGLFRAVTLQPERPAASGTEPDSEARVDWPVLVRVEERPPRSVRVSVGYGTEDEFRARLDWVHRNFFGGARTVDLTTKYSSLVAGVEGRFVQPHFLDRKMSLEAKASFLRETLPAYDAQRAAAGLLLSRDLDSRWTVRAGYRFELGDVTNRATDAFDAPESSRLSTLLFGLERSSLDDRIDPGSGTWLQLSLEPTLAALGSEASFIGFGAEARSFHPVFGAVLALRVQLATVLPVEDSRRDDVPLFSRLYAGGSGSVRGFQFQRVPPLDAEGDPLGGLSRALASAELRFPIWRFLHGVLFIDAGQLARGPFRLELDEFYPSVGPGIRIKTAFGSIGLDYGYLLRRPDRADRGRIHFSVGKTF